MSIIRQGSLFDMQDFYELEPSKRFEAVFSTLHIEPLLFTVNKKSVYGAPTELNYPAMIYALVARKRLTQDFMFRLDCGFLFSDRIPSEASFSRLTSKLSDSTAFESVQDSLLLQAIQEGFVCDEVVAID
jgi:transposase